jgi:hypothetical protein
MKKNEVLVSKEDLQNTDTQEKTSHALTVYDMYQQKMSAVYQQMKIAQKSGDALDGGAMTRLCYPISQFLQEAIGLNENNTAQETSDILVNALVCPLMNGGAGWSNEVAEAFFKVTGVTAKDAKKKEQK